MIADIVVGLSWGDEGKGKVTYHLLKSGEYTHCIRYNGGCNAGHTIYHNGIKHITHHIPSGPFFNIKSIIGPGCVVNVAQFFKEINELEEKGINTKGLVFIAENAHVITNKHLEEDQKDKKIGTTKKGNGPAYRDKYARQGIRAKNIPELEPYIIDIYEELHNRAKNPVILFEGAQGFGLDIDWGDYPYVTSSHCTAGSVLLNGIPPQAIRNIWGVAKAYDTYVGTKEFQGNDPILETIQKIGQEYGATTGRKRQVNWLNLDSLKKAIKINGVTHFVMNKMDILDKAKRWSTINHNSLVSYLDSKGFITHIKNELNNTTVNNFYFSSSPHHI